MCTVILLNNNPNIDTKNKMLNQSISSQMNIVYKKGLYTAHLNGYDPHLNHYGMMGGQFQKVMAALQL